MGPVCTLFSFAARKAPGDGRSTFWLHGHSLVHMQEAESQPLQWSLALQLKDALQINIDLARLTHATNNLNYFWKYVVS
jgi:hypothetical protein